MSGQARPPLLARALLRWRLGDEAVGQTIRGDLWQEYAERRRSGRWRARAWYWREALGVMRPRAHHPARPSRWLRTWGQDARDAARSLRRSPGYTVLAVSLLVLGITATTAIFAAVNALFLRPPPHVAEPDRLVQVYTSDFSGRRFGVSAYPDFEDVRDRVDAFEEVAAFRLGETLLLSLDDGVRQEFGVAVSSGYFGVLGVDLPVGRAFTGDEVGPAGAEDIVVLGHRTWTDMFGADPEIIGREVRINGRVRQVVGVAPAGLQAPGFPVVPGAYLPLAGEETAQRGSRSLGILARLAPAATPVAAQAQLDALGAALHSEHPRLFTDRTDAPRELTLLRESEARLSPELRTSVMAFMVMLLVGVGAVLLIACSNLAHLALVRAGARAGDLAVRRALGAAQGRLVRLLLLESVWIGVLGGLAAVVAVAVVTRALAGFGGFPGGAVLQFDLDLRVAAFAAVVSVGTGMLFGLLPARRIGRAELTPLLHGANAPGVVGGRGRAGAALVLVQVAASVALVVLSGLFLRSLQGAADVDPGFEAEGVAVLRVELDQIALEPEEGRAAFDAMLAELRRRSDVEAAALASRVPLAGGWERALMEIEGYVSEDGRSPEVSAHQVSDDYFRLMRIPVLQGREFDAGDRGDGRPVAVVNDTFVRQFWDGDDAIGRRIGLGDTSYEVVGVVAQTLGRQLAEDPLPQVWFPLHQRYRSSAYVHARGRAAEPDGELLRAVSDAALRAAPGLPLLETVWMPSLTANATLPQRVASTVLGAAGGMALFLAAVGLHGVIGYGVSRRIPEIGLRRAVGASTGAVLRTVFGRVVWIVSAGAVVGAAIAMAVAQGARDLLVGVEPVDPTTLLLAMGCLVAAAAIAAVGPVRRALSVDPVRALRAS